MNAFIKTENGTYKVYRHGGDWQVLGPSYERWHSVWQADVMGSLLRALEDVPGFDRSIEIISLN